MAYVAPAATFTIWVRTTDGVEFAAFTWTRSAQTGIDRAKAEAGRFGHDVADVWAVAV